MVPDASLDHDELWQATDANSICVKITKGTTPPKDQIDPASDIPFLRVNNLTVGGARGVSGELLFVTPKAHSGFLSRSIAYPGDVLMNIVGPPLGKVTLLTEQFSEYNLNQAVLIYRVAPNAALPEFLYFYLCSDTAQQWLEARAKNTARVPLCG